MSVEAGTILFPMSPFSSAAEPSAERSDARIRSSGEPQVVMSFHLHNQSRRQQRGATDFEEPVGYAKIVAQQKILPDLENLSLPRSERGNGGATSSLPRPSL